MREVRFPHKKSNDDRLRFIQKHPAVMNVTYPPLFSA
jgi:hypothetical protein